VPSAKCQVPSNYLTSFPFVKYLSEVFLTKQLLFFSKFPLEFCCLRLQPYFFANNKRLTLFMEQEASPLVNTNAQKKGNYLGGSFMEKNKILVGKALGIGLFVLILLVAGCSDGSSNNELPKRDELSEEDAFVNSIVINDSADEVGMFFISYPDSSLYNSPYKEMLEGAAQITEDYGLIWADKIPNKDDSWTKPFSEGGNGQVSGSGFSMKIATKGGPEGKNAAIGIGHYFYMTAENLGSEIFGNLSNLVNTLTVNAEQRVTPTATQFSSVGLHIYCNNPNNAERDITDQVTIEISLAEKSEGKLMLVYGCVLVDRELTAEEGEEVPFIPGAPQVLLSDGKKDGNIEASWWIKKSS
jgi:hypothetical protein